MGIPQAWKVVTEINEKLQETKREEVEQTKTGLNLKKKGKGKGKGKEKAIDPSQEDEVLDVQTRASLIMFNVGDMRQAFDCIIRRVRQENQPNSQIIFTLYLDINSIGFRQYEKARELVRKERNLSPVNRQKASKRLQYWITRSFCDEYGSMLPPGSQLELHADHHDRRGMDKMVELEHRYLKDAEELAKSVIAELLGVQATEKKQKKRTVDRRKRKEWNDLKRDQSGQETQDAGMADGGVGGDEKLVDKSPEQIKAIAGRLVDERSAETGPLRLPTIEDANDDDRVISLLCHDIRSKATLVTAHREADDSILARVQHSNRFEDRRIDVVLPRYPSLVPLVPPASSSSSSSPAIHIKVLVTGDSDSIFQHDHTQARFVVAPYKLQKKDAVRALDLLGLHEVSRDSWPFEDVQATRGAMLMVSRERGEKVTGLRTLIKKRGLPDFLNQLEEIRRSIKRFKDSKDIEYDLPSLPTVIYKGFKGLNEGIVDLYRQQLDVEPPWEIKEFLNLIDELRKGAKRDRNLISKSTEIKRMTVEAVTAAIDDIKHELSLEIDGRPSRDVRRHRRACRRRSSSLPIDGYRRSDKTAARVLDDLDHQIAQEWESSRPSTPELPPLSPDPSKASPLHAEPTSADVRTTETVVTSPSNSNPLASRSPPSRLSQYRVRSYQESFILSDNIEQDIATQQQIDQETGVVAPLPAEQEKKSFAVKQKWRQAEVSSSKEKRISNKRSDVVDGVGVKLAGFTPRCISKIPMNASAFRDLLFNRNVFVDSTDLSDIVPDFDLEELTPGWSESALWVYRTILDVGRDASFEMGQRLEEVMRATITFEPGFLHAFTESTSGAVQLCTAIRSVLSSLDVDTKIDSPTLPATRQELDTFFEKYDNKGKVPRTTYSNAIERELAKRALTNCSVTKDQLEQFLLVCKQNGMVCIGMLFDAIHVKNASDVFAPVIDYAAFFTLNMTAAGVNAVVNSRQFATTWSSAMAKLLLSSSRQLPSLFSLFPFAYNTNPAQLPSTPLSLSAQHLLHNISKHHLKPNRPYSTLLSKLIDALKSIDTLPGAPPPTFPNLSQQLVDCFHGCDSIPTQLLDLYWQPSNISDFEDGKKEAMERIVELLRFVGELAQRGIKEGIEHVEEVEKANAKNDSSASSQNRKKRSEQLKEIATIGDYELLTVEGVQPKIDGSEDDEMKNTVSGGVGAKEFRVFSHRWDALLGRNTVAFEPQFCKLNSQLVAYLTRTPIKGETVSPVIKFFTRTISRRAQAIEQMNLLNLSPASPDQDTEMKENQPLDQRRVDATARARESADRFMGFARGRIDASSGKGKQREIPLDQDWLGKEVMDVDDVDEPRVVEMDGGGGIDRGGGGGPSNSTPAITAATVDSASPPLLPSDSTTAAQTADQDRCRPILAVSGVPFLVYEARYHQNEKAKLRPGEVYKPRLLIPGTHDSGIIKFKSVQQGSIAEIEIDDELVSAFEDAVDRVQQLYTAPFSATSTFTDRDVLIPQSGHDFIATTFTASFGSRIPYDLIVLKEGEIQLFYIDPRRADSDGMRLMKQHKVPRSLSWTIAFPLLLSKKKKKNPNQTKTLNVRKKSPMNHDDDEWFRSAKDQKSTPDLHYALEKTRWSQILVRRTIKRDSYGWKRREAREESLGGNIETHRGADGREFELVCAEPLFKLVGVKDIKWFKPDHWLLGRRQGPILFDDTDPLFLLPAGPPLSSPRNSRAARTVEEAKGALGKLTPPTTSHSIISVDPGERFLVAAHVSQPGSRESRFITLGKEGPAEERRRAADIRRELGTRGLQAQVLADFTGSNEGSFCKAFSRISPHRDTSSTTITAPPSLHRNTLATTIAAPPLPFVSSPQILPIHKSPFLNSFATLIPAPLIRTFLASPDIRLSAFNLHNARRQQSRNQSQAALAIGKALPRVRKVTNGKTKFVKQTAAYVIGAGDGKTKAWGMRFGSAFVKLLFYGAKSRGDLMKIYLLKVLEPYTSQLCPKCIKPLIYAAEWVGKVLKLDLRILVCLWCNIHWHRDKVGAMNLVANLANFLHLRKNIRSPVFSIPLGHGARFSGSNPTTKLSIAYYSTQKKEEGQDVAKVESERFTELIEGMEEVEQEKRRVVKELKDAEVENGDDDDGGEGGSDSEEDE